jgi:HlyD family secretion protein
MVPSAAFRFRPEGAGAAPAARPGAAAAGAGPPRGRPGGGLRSGGRGGEAQAKVYVLQGGAPMERTVRLGLSDGQRTEILDGLQEGDAVIVGQATKGGNNQQRAAPRLRL